MQKKHLEIVYMFVFFRAVGLALAFVLLLSPIASAQKVSPAAGDPYKSVVVTRPSPYWGYIRDPYDSTLHGLADLTRATGTYHIRIQQAARLREENRQLKLKTRRAELEHIKWEINFIREMRQEEIERTIKTEEHRARERPPMTEILAGTALNWIISGLKKDTAYPSDSRSKPLKQEWLNNVNFISTGGHAGMLREKQFIWPVLLQEERFAGAREKIESLFEQARQDARRGKLSGKVVKELLEQHKHLDESATAEATRMGAPWEPGQHIMAIRFLRELKQTLLLMQNPKEASFLLDHRPKCSNVTELVQHMRERGLTFGPASAGSEKEYLSIHDAIAQEARLHETKKSSKQSSVP
jgi:hypothetical protein